jgi:hypothetical protein
VGKGRPARKADNLTAICEPTVSKMWDPQRLTTLWVSMACYTDSFTFYLYLQPPLALASDFQFHDYFTDGRTPWMSDHLVTRSLP